MQTNKLCIGFAATAAAASFLLVFGVTFTASASTNLPSYYAHAAELDRYGVMLNIAVNIYKRYPWVDKPKAVKAAHRSGNLPRTTALG